ncbi:hypothetical protein Scep_018950 [Stephania cephalantha]|uniref:Alanyl-tRNA synthetase class IIc N-terminal domain-containing protein n=1 Tax=Stephania cephalantha TaxID=152367 RepID=A0AAP0NPC4_9MAGN
MRYGRFIKTSQIGLEAAENVENRSIFWSSALQGQVSGLNMMLNHVMLLLLIKDAHIAKGSVFLWPMESMSYMVLLTNIREELVHPYMGRPRFEQLLLFKRGVFIDLVLNSCYCSKEHMNSLVSGGSIRLKFLEFYASRGHNVLPSSSLVPDDPIVLLTIVGMLQFKPIFLGKICQMPMKFVMN